MSEPVPERHATLEGYPPPDEPVGASGDEVVTPADATTLDPDAEVRRHSPCVQGRRLYFETCRVQELTSIGTQGKKITVLTGMDCMTKLEVSLPRSTFEQEQPSVENGRPCHLC